MKAIVKYAAEPGHMEIRDVPEPSPAPGQIKIEVRAAGVCGSDLHIHDSDIAIPVRPPVTVGHEFSGVIAELGEGVTGFKVGERVVSETAFSFCGVCENCREGWYNLCPERKTLGYWYNGIFTKYTVVPAGRVHRIPENVSDVAAAMTEPLACVCHALFDLTVISPTDLVLVFGPGPIGLMAMQVARAYGARVLVSGIDADTERLELARELGAEYTVNSQKEDLQEFVSALTGGKGVDVVLECSGNQHAINAGLKALKRRGHYTQVGMGAPVISFYIEAINYKEPIVSGSLGSRKANWIQAVDLLARGKVRVEELANVRLPMERWQEAFDRFRRKDGGKFILLPFTEE